MKSSFKNFDKDNRKVGCLTIYRWPNTSLGLTLSNYNILGIFVLAFLYWKNPLIVRLSTMHPTTFMIKCIIKSVIQKLPNSENKTIHIYGASTKLNTILGFCDIDTNLIKYAAERSPEKCGSKTISGIKIISEEESLAMNPDYYLVLPWHFKKEFIEREKEALAKGTGFIFPIPTIDIYKNN